MRYILSRFLNSRAVYICAQHLDILDWPVYFYILSNIEWICSFYENIEPRAHINM